MVWLSKGQHAQQEYATWTSRTLSSGGVIVKIAIPHTGSEAGPIRRALSASGAATTCRDRLSSCAAKRDTAGDAPGAMFRPPAG